jgi:hypothetical protein
VNSVAKQNQGFKTRKSILEKDGKENGSSTHSFLFHTLSHLSEWDSMEFISPEK